MTESSSPATPESRAAHVISQVYYYVAAVGAFGLFLGGSIALLFGIRELAFPREFETTREGVRTLLHGLAFVVPGLAIMWWHLRQARRREDRPTSTVFWGRVLYFHLVALISLLFAVIGTVGVLFHLGAAATSECKGFPQGIAPIPHSPEVVETLPSDTFLEEQFCYPTREDSLRSAVDTSIFLIVAGPVFWWHLRQGRRLTAPQD